MALILSIETATPVCSVALHLDGRLLGLYELYQERSHSTALANLIKQVIFDNGFEMKDLEAVAISQGPGSYTGLRIGTATAKGLCFALDIPLIAVSTLKSMAAGMTHWNPSKAWLCPMIDARRMEVYCWLADDQLNELIPEQAQIMDTASYENELCMHPILFFGTGVTKCGSLWTGQTNVLIKENFEASASFVGPLAEEQLRQGIFADLAYFKPTYLKEFQTTLAKNTIVN